MTAKDVFLFIPHTHWEGAVFKTREQYLEMGLPIILRALRLLKKHPHYRFVLDQACYVQPFFERYPEEVASFKAYVAEGRLVITGGLDVMPDVNMPGGESFVRQAIYGKSWFRAALGVEIPTGWQLDTFGHHAQMPQLMRQAGYTSFWTQRGVPHGDVPSEFIWEGLDGTRIPYYWLPGNYAITYNSPKTMPGFGEFMRKRYDFLTKYSLGAGRVGPAGADVCLPEEHVPELIDAFNQDADSPFELRIGLPADYEALVEARPEPRPVISGEMNPIFQGTYSSRIELKQWMRELETLLLSAEKAGALLLALGEEVDNSLVWKAWEPVLFNQAHDLMSGVMTDQVWEDTQLSFAWSRRLVSEELAARQRRLAARVDTRGEGVPVVVVNHLGWPRTDVVVASAGFTELEAQGLELRGPAGEVVPVQVLEAERADNGALIHARVAFVAREVPAFGHQVYRLLPRELPNAEPVADAGNVLENEFVRVEVDLSNGQLTSLVWKESGWEALRGAGNRVTREEDHGDLWEPYRGLNGAQAITMKERHPAPPLETTVTGAAGSITRGPVFSEFRAQGGELSSRIRVYAGLPRVEIQTRLHNEDSHVRYRVCFPTSLQGGQATHEIPFGAIPHPDGVEFPAQTWIDLSGGGQGLALLNRGLPGNNAADGVLLLSLLRSATIGGYGFGGGYEPGMGSDSGLELGKDFTFEYALLPHVGAWDAAGLPRAGQGYNTPLTALTAGAHPGDLAAEWGFLSVSCPDVLVSALKPGEKGGIVLRLYESAGRAQAGVTVQLPPQVTTVREVNLLEDVLGELPAPAGQVTLSFRPFEIKTLAWG